MFNLRFAFDEAVTAVTEFSGWLKIPSLPATVFLMQGDVINHYHHALTHYLTVPLSSSFLMNSSQGPPYQKWARVTNQDFNMLSFAVGNLLRYSSRLFHESTAAALRHQHRFEEYKHRSNAFTDPIARARSRGPQIGIVARPDEHLDIHFIRIGPPEVRIGQRSSGDGPSVCFRIDENSHPPREIIIEHSEYMDLASVIRTETVSVSNRLALLSILERGMAELEILKKLHRDFAESCRKRFRKTDPFGAFDAMNEDWWL